MPNNNLHCLKAISIMMSYPSAELIENIPALRKVINNSNLFNSKNKKTLNNLLDNFLNTDILDLQEDYVATFDRGRSHCLHLFEHIHGESRDRGPALVDLAELYETKGIVINTAEMPDYLPLFLEYLSLCETNEAIKLLDEPITVIATIGAKLNNKKSRWAVLFDALEVIAKVKPDMAMVADAVENDNENINDLEALDKEWEETEAFSDNSTDDCNTCEVMPNTTQALKEATQEVS